VSLAGSPSVAPAAVAAGVRRPPRPIQPRNLVLIGFSYTGKSTIGRLLARRLRWRSVDTDRLIRQRTGQTPQEIFATRGEPAFREIERQVVEKACRGQRQVIATGGGAPIDPACRAAMFDGNVVVLLDATPEAIFRRMVHSATGENRPMLDHPEPLERIRSLKQVRDPIYRQAHLVVETERLQPIESAELIYRLAGIRG
jgi:shikimate kinase